MGGTLKLFLSLTLLGCVSLSFCENYDRPPIFFKGGSFDPDDAPTPSAGVATVGATIASERLGLEGALPADNEARSYVVQFRGAVNSEVRDAVRQVCETCVLGHYIPTNAYVVYATPEEILVLQAQVPSVVYAGEIPSEYKLSPAVLVGDMMTPHGVNLRAGSPEEAVFPLSKPSYKASLVAIVSDGYLHRREAQTAGMCIDIVDTLADEIDIETVTVTCDVGTGRKVLVTIDDPTERVMSAALKKAAHALAGMKFVEWVERKGVDRASNHFAKYITQTNDSKKGQVFTEGGLTGEGQILGIGDTGIDTDRCFFKDDKNDVPFDKIDQKHRKIVTYVTKFGDDSDYYSGHGTHTSGSLAGSGSGDVASKYGGMAEGAKLAFVDFTKGQDNEVNTPADLATDYFPLQYDAGARISSNSWGNSVNLYSSNAGDIDRYVAEHPDFLVIFAAGNTGACGVRTVASPATAKNGLAIGATETELESYVMQCYGDPNCENTKKENHDEFHMFDRENIAMFSGRGPSLDGRFKPDIMAPGDSVWSAQSLGDEKGESADCDKMDCVTAKSGTSMATPIVAGNAGMVREYFMKGFYPTGMADAKNALTPSAALLKAVLINSGRSLSGYVDHFDRTTGKSDRVKIEAAPAYDQGFGSIQLDSVLPLANKVKGSLYVSDKESLDTGDEHTKCFKVPSGATKPFKATMTWMEKEAAALSSVVVVNNLDLVVTGPNGEVVLGNSYRAAASEQQADVYNNVEQVELTPSKEGGEYCVTVFAVMVAQGLNDDGKQPYALVVSGDFDQESAGKDAKGPTCVNNCHEDKKQGQCGKDGMCECASGFAGVDCSATFCPSRCSLNGDCVAGKCECHEGYAGNECQFIVSKMDMKDAGSDKGITTEGYSYTTVLYHLDNLAPESTADVTITMMNETIYGDEMVATALVSNTVPENKDFTGPNAVTFNKKEPGKLHVEMAKDATDVYIAVALPSPSTTARCSNFYNVTAVVTTKSSDGFSFRGLMRWIRGLFVVSNVHSLESESAQ